MSPRTDVLTPQRDTVSVSAPHSNALGPHDVGILILRIALGVIMIAHGTQKLFGWFGGGGIDGTAAFFEKSGYPAARMMAVVAALCETGGGLALILGLLTPLAGAAVLGTMINAIGVKWGGGFLASNGGFEFELLLAGAAGALCLLGAGAISVDRAIPSLRQHKPSYGVGAALLGVITGAILLLIRS